MCGEVYLYFKDELDKDFMEPRDAPDMPRFRLVDMYHSRTDQCVKDAITSLFSDNLPLRIVVASVSYGMGVDCPHVRQVIHIGPPSDCGSYIQETGRAGRDRFDSIAALYLIKGMGQVEACMKKYISNDSLCRRNILFNAFTPNQFSPPCTCCDVCARDCTCPSSCATPFII
jgi:ATP-dependent DNA helicase RecQ